jgi:NADPH:quinone reductase-like Zn-dependent oxidoreductase
MQAAPVAHRVLTQLTASGSSLIASLPNVRERDSQSLPCGMKKGSTTVTLKTRIGGAVLAVLIIVIAALALALSHESPCPDAQNSAAMGETMKAVMQRCYGSGAVLRLEDVARPVPATDEVLIRVRAAAVNPLDWHGTAGKPYFMRLSIGIGAPTDARMGVDFSGVVEAVGQHVTHFKPGDAVFGASGGSFAQYVKAREGASIVRVPENMNFEQAAAIPIAAITALQGLRDHGHVQAGQKVLINGASGGVGTFAIQIAKFLGAEVTGVCSTRNVDLVRSLGADHVIDYTQRNFTQGTDRYDVVLDNVGNHSLLDVRRVVNPKGTLVIVSGPKREPFLGPLWRMLGALVIDPFVDQNLVTFIADMNQPDLEFLASLARAGKLKPVIDKRYSLSEVPQAIDYQGTGHARGKIIVRIE